jgi:hypothetical protein
MAIEYAKEVVVLRGEVVYMDTRVLHVESPTWIGEELPFMCEAEYLM